MIGRFRVARPLAAALLPFLLVSVPRATSIQGAADPLLAALEAEVSRAATGFARGDRPAYFVGYELSDRWADDIVAQNGGVTSGGPRHERLLDVDLRVGSYKFDNTHRNLGGREALARLPVDDDPAALRTAIWLATEDAYRGSVEEMIRIEAQRSTAATAADTSPDMSRDPTLQRLEAPPAPRSFDRAAWTGRVSRLAARLARLPGIHESFLSLSVERTVRYVVTSEGTRVRTGGGAARLTAVVSTRAEDGMDLQLNRVFHAATLDGLPAENAMGASLDSMAAALEALRTAPVVNPSAGPAILSARASAVFFHEVLGHRLEGHRQKDERFGQTFTGRPGETVLPVWLSIVDDPTREKYAGLDLAGHYAVDDEGVAARPTPLVTRGVLTGFLMGRSPIQPAPASNGHGRRQAGFGVVARQGALIVESDKAVTPAELRQQLIQEIKRQNKPYGFYFDEIEGGFTLTARGGPQAFKVLPLEVHRVYADGRPDELVRGVDIVGTPLTVLSKILAVDDHPAVFNGFCGAESGSIPVSAAAPAMLVSEVEIERRATSQSRPPILAPPLGSARPAQPDDDALLVALGDEMARTRDSLRLPDLGPPYYVGYRVNDAVTFSVDATLGALVQAGTQRSRQLEMDLRVGTMKDDNSGGFQGQSSIALPLDADYLALRRQVWSLTDGRYRTAASALARRKAQRTGQTGSDSTPGFTAAPPTVRLDRPAPLTLPDSARWVDAARVVSRVFRTFPTIEDSHVRVDLSRRNRYILTSEGGKARLPAEAASILITATARGASGRTVTDHRLFLSPALSGLPANTVLEQAARSLGEELTAVAAGEAPDSYVGPVLFEGRSAAQFFNALLGRQLGGQFSGAAQDNPLEHRLQRRILPQGYNVTDDPTLESFAGSTLMGHYVLDDEGMLPRAVHVVENGVLKALPLSRTPTKRLSGTTGHGRSFGFDLRASMSSLIVQPPDAAMLDSAALRKKLIALAADLGQTRALVVRALYERGTTLGLTVAAGPEGRSDLPMPVDAVLLSADGKEVPVRGLSFEDVPIRTLRDIVAAGRNPIVYNIGLDGFNGARTRTGGSVVAPAVLVEELELTTSTRREKPPVLKSPLFEPHP
jgi:predicted Zn-dependent protease